MGLVNLGCLPRLAALWRNRLVLKIYFVVALIGITVVLVSEYNLAVLPDRYHWRYMLPLCVAVLSFWLTIAFAWKWNLSVTAGVSIPLASAFRHAAMLLLGKYLPGKIWGVLARGQDAMINQRLAGSNVYAATYLEQLISIHAGLVVGVATLTLLVPDLALRAVLWIVVVLSVFIIPFVHKFIKDLTPERFRRRYVFLQTMMSKVTLSTPDYTRLTCVYLLEWVAMGLVLVLVVALVTGEVPPRIDAFLYLGVNSLAMIAGFLALFAPGGIGVREGVIVALISPRLGLETALMISVTMRLVTVAADFVAGAIAMLLRAKSH